ncbi:hypothetical protein DPSP01_013410 [Paraphaeosphaeria sporulosa]
MELFRRDSMDLANMFASVGSIIVVPSDAVFYRIRVPLKERGVSANRIANEGDEE